MSIELARRYVALSNDHDLAGIADLLDADAEYRSARVGAFEGREAILAMMDGFFRRYPDVHWEVDEFRPAPDGPVHFDYRIDGTNAEDGSRLTGDGSEVLHITAGGRIRRVEVV